MQEQQTEEILGRVHDSVLVIDESHRLITKNKQLDDMMEHVCASLCDSKRRENPSFDPLHFFMTEKIFRPFEDNKDSEIN